MTFNRVRRIIFMQCLIIYLKQHIGKMQMLKNLFQIELPNTSDQGQRMRRSSKICSALKTQFLAMLQEQGATIKYAAKHLGINYSTAKVIAKQNRHLLKEKNTSHSDNQEEYLPSKEKRSQPQKKQNPRCGYKILPEIIEPNIQGPQNFPHIEIISTVAWNFLEWGLPINTKKGSPK